MTDPVAKIAVIGAGVSGLTSVYCLMRELSSAGINFKITIFADKVLGETLSSGAGGCFRPDPHVGVDPETNDRWARSTWDHFSSIARSPQAKNAGVYFVTGLHVSSRSQFNMDHVKKFCLDLQALTPEQIASLLPSKFKYGFLYTTIIVDPGFYLKWLLSHALSRCNLVLRRIESLDKDDALSDYDVIVNCSGLSSGVIAGDDRLIPVRGQTIRVHAPWIKMFTWADGAYIYPKADGTVTLGGIKQFGNSNPDVDESDKEWIWSRCTELQPSLKDCPIVQDWVGLRPFRQPIRVESQTLPNGRQIVHNYGHGGNGYTYSHGTAMDTTDLVKQFLYSNIRARL